MEAVTQLQAKQSLLSAVRGRPGFNGMSAAEKGRVESLIRAKSWRTEELSAVAGAIRGAGFADEHEAQLLDLMCDPARFVPAGTMEESGSGRAGLQSWEIF